MKRPPAMRARTLLAPRGHAVYELGPGLLLVFKPRGHREEKHAHAYAQRLDVLSGRLAVRIGDRSTVVTAKTGSFTIPAAREHATTARAATWLVAQRRPGKRRR